MFGVPQGPIFGPLPVNIFMCYLFTILEEIDFAIYVNENTPFISETTAGNVVSSLKAILLVYLNGFQMIKCRQTPKNVIY